MYFYNVLAMPIHACISSRYVPRCHHKIKRPNFEIHLFADRTHLKRTKPRNAAPHARCLAPHIAHASPRATVSLARGHLLVAAARHACLA